MSDAGDAQAALQAAGIDAVAMADDSRLVGAFDELTMVEVAVPRRHALEAAHILRVPPPPEVEQDDPRPSRLGMAAVAVLVIICLLLLAGFVLLSPPRAG